MTTKEEILRLALRFPDSYSDMPFDDNWTVVRHRDNKKIFAWIFERRRPIGGTYGGRRTIR